MTDEARMYRKIGKKYADHQTVNHGKDEYVRGEAYTNTVEGFFGAFKRGMTGTDQHCGSNHLHRYLSEFDFRYTIAPALRVMIKARLIDALKANEGKRLTYQRPN